MGNEFFLHSTAVHFASSQTGFIANIDDPQYSAYALLGTIDYVVGGHMTIMLAVVGVVTNIMAVMVLASRGVRINFNYLLICLAVFDLLFLLLSIAESVRKTF